MRIPRLKELLALESSNISPDGLATESTLVLYRSRDQGITHEIINSVGSEVMEDF